MSLKGKLSGMQSVFATDGAEPTQFSLAPLDIQVGGTHYKKLIIQPVEYIHKNGIGFMEGSAIKYLSRWKVKGGLEDLRKAKHFIEMLIEMEEENTRLDQERAMLAIHEQAIKDTKAMYASADEIRRMTPPKP